MDRFLSHPKRELRGGREAHGAKRRDEIKLIKRNGSLSLLKERTGEVVYLK